MTVQVKMPNGRGSGYQEILFTVSVDTFEFWDYIIQQSSCQNQNFPLTASLHQIRRVPKVLQSHEILLDAPGANEPIKNTDAPSLIIRAACSRTAERLLAYDSACTFFIVVHVSGCVTELVGGEKESTAVSCETVPLRRVS